MQLTRVDPDLEKASDRELLTRIQGRDQTAFETLFRRYYPRVFSFVNRRLRDAALTEEIVVDVFFAVWEAASGFRGDSRTSSWIFGIAHFKALEAHRNRSAGKRASVIPIETAALHRAPDPHGRVDQLEARDEMRRLGEIVRSLDGTLREAVELVWLEGLSQREAAERLGVSTDTIKARVWRARQQVRRELRATGEDGE